MKKTTTFVRILSALMATIMFAVAIPVQAIALPADELEQIETEQIEATTETAVTNAPTEQDIFIVEEDTSKRGQFEKHYLCSDGTYVSVTYPEAIHYLDEDRTWKDVDQSLTYDAATGTYASERADFRVSFSGKASATNMAQIERNGHTLSWGIQTASKGIVRSTDATYAQSSRTILDEVQTVLIAPSERLAQVAVAPSVSFERNSERLVSNEDSFLLPNISSQISYADIFAGENVSIKYTVYHNKVEEDIIISERGDIHSVSMNMDVGTLTPVVNADGSVDLVDDTNTMQFHVGIPYMMDADFSVCNDIEVTAEKTGTTCIITYTPNAEWFDSSERIFPILLDPSITTNEYVANMYDTYVEENATANHTSEQFMYVNPNGSNRRKAIVQIRKLPAIDASMPIVRAQLTLTTQYPPFSDVLLQAEYGVTDLHVLEYDYEMADAFAPSFTTLAYLTTDQTAVWFDFTPHIYQMYADEAYAAEVGKIYMGDFVIGFADSATPTYVYPFHTSESTTPANRPVLKVNYGYALPAGMLNGGIYSFVNYGSYSYMSVNGTEPANNSNVYQIWPTNGNPTNAQKFKLEYVESTGGYLLRSMASSEGTDKVVDIQRSGGSIYSGRNVQIYSATDPISQEWLIVPVDDNRFRIVPRSNMSLALTAYGYDDGTNTGKTSTSEGNIFVKTLTEGDAFQKWYIEDNTGSEICVSEYSWDFKTGNYYIVNSYVGRYLHRTGTTANCARNKISSLGEDTVKWRIVNLGDGYYTIQRSDIAGYYLAPSSTSGNPVYVYQNQSETIPDRYKWSITIADGGGCLIRNKETALYLKALVSTTNPSSVSVAALSGEGTVGYRQQTWYVVSEDDYVELNQSVTFNDITIDFGVPQAASVNRTPSNAYFASYTDFDYTITSGSDCLTYDVSTYKFTGVAPGTATVRATHKTTGIVRSFKITVLCPTVVIPCTFARAASYNTIKNFPISITPYIAEYSSYLNDVTWQAYGNGAAIFDLQNMTVTGVSSGFAWLEAKKGDDTVLVCFVYVEDILKGFSAGVQDFLYIDGTILGTASCLQHNSNPGIDPYILRTEWYLYAIKLLNAGKSDEEIRLGLNEQFGLDLAQGDTFQWFISEVALGSQGGYSRDQLRLSFDGIRFLFNFYWGQYAAYCIATLDTVNIYTPATPQDVIDEQNAARKMCREARTVIEQAQQAQSSSGYQKDSFQPTLLKAGTKICGMREGQTAWYTTPECASSSNYNVKTLYNKLQVSYNPNYGYRTTMGYYEVLEDTYVAYGQALNNTAYGEGGYDQYFIPDYSKVLKLLYEVPLNE